MSSYKAGRQATLLTPSTAWILKSLLGKARTTKSSVPESITTCLNVNQLGYCAV